MPLANSPVFIAGIGICHPRGSHDISDTVLAAGTKALLDAGLTYKDVKQSVACFLDEDLSVKRESFETYGRTGTPVCRVDNYSGFHVASQFVKAGGAQCVMMVGFDQGYSRRPSSDYRVASIALILVSQTFLQSHAYLKDSAILILASQVNSPIHSRTSNADDETIATRTSIQAALRQSALLPEDFQIVELRHGSNQSVQAALGEMKVNEDSTASPVSHPFIGQTGLGGLCELVWQLRGWTRQRSVPQARNCLQYTLGPDGTAYATVLSRADGRAAPSWDQVEHVRDGRERLAHNPATETREVSFEDWEAVKANDNFVPVETVKRLRLAARGGDRAALARL